MNCGLIRRPVALAVAVLTVTASFAMVAGAPPAAADDPAPATTTSTTAIPPKASSALPPATSGSGATPSDGPAPAKATTATLPPASSGGPAPSATVPVPAAPVPTSTTVLASPRPPTTAGTGAKAAPPTTVGPPSIRLDTANPAQVELLNSQLRSARVDLDAAQTTQQAAQRLARVDAAATIAAQATLDELATQERAAVENLRVTHNRLRDLAVSSYLSGGQLTEVNGLLESQSINDFFRRQAYISIVDRTNGQALKAYAKAQQEASKAAKKTYQALIRSQAAKQQADQAVVAASAMVAERTITVADRTQAVQLAGLAVGFPGTDIPTIVLDAYQKAAATVQQEGCLLPWSALAGIGRVESDHGRAQHAQLTATGELVPPIVGLPLNGLNGTALIPASDKGLYTGDPVYEHAVGPMQFLPSTWAVIGRDGNGDGTADPNNIFDAALGAASYLCRAGAGAAMNTDAGLRQAFFSYNHSDGYVEEVLALAHTYAAIDIGTSTDAGTGDTAGAGTAP
jgi:membrane-bound lytic murein transglycosylase B